MSQPYHRNALTLFAVLAIAACSGPSSTPTAATTAPSGATGLTLPVSLNEIMVGAVDDATYALFDVGNAVRNDTKLPTTDEDWREVRDNALQMVAMGKVIQMPGTGPEDAQWTSAPTWKSWAESLSAIGVDMLKLAAARDTNGFVDAGDRLVAVCEGCHREFKPELPTMNTYRRSAFPPAETK